MTTAQNFLARDQAVVWHPFTQMKDHLTYPPLVVDRAEGVHLYDPEGNAYIDAIGSWWCNIHGHCHPRLQEAVTRQMKQLDHVLFAGVTHQPGVELAERLVEITPSGLEKVFYSDNGSTANEIAMKLSVQYWAQTGQPQKKRFVHLDLSYHGDTFGTMSVGGLFGQAFQGMMKDAFQVATPYTYRSPQGQSPDQLLAWCISQLEAVLKTHGDEIAAFILEPLLLGAAGMVMIDPEFLTQARRLTQDYGVHLIVDEVATGFGHTGKMFATDWVGIVPDMMCLSKGLTAGVMPLAATVVTPSIYDAFYDDDRSKAFLHGHTFTGNPLGCAVALASLDLFKSEDRLAHVQQLSQKLPQKLKRFESLPTVGEVRQLGLVVAFEMVQDRATKTRYPKSAQLPQKIYQEGLKKGVILRPLGPVLYGYPPLCITEVELDKIWDATYDILSRLDEIAEREGQFDYVGA